MVAAARYVGRASGPCRRKITAVAAVVLLFATHAAGQQQRYRPEQSAQGGAARRQDVVGVDTHRASVSAAGANQGLGHRGQEIVTHGVHRAQDPNHDPRRQGAEGAAMQAPRRPASNRGSATPTPADHRAAGNGSGPPRVGSGGDIVFPDRQFKPRIGPGNPGCALGTTFCEDVSDYPGSHVSNVLANTIQFQEFFGSDVPPPQLSDRISPERTLCDAQEKLIFPKMAQNANNEWMYVVNLGDQYKQGIRVELCRGEGNACLMADLFPAGSHATCRQKYIYRKLVALSESGEPVPDSFRLPSCCACFVEESVLSGRFGGRANTNGNVTERGRR